MHDCLMTLPVAVTKNIFIPVIDTYLPGNRLFYKICTKLKKKNMFKIEIVREVYPVFIYLFYQTYLI